MVLWQQSLKMVNGVNNGKTLGRETKEKRTKKS